MKHVPQWIWITGASDGLGKALALEYAKCGTSLILSSRNTSALEKLAETCSAIGAPQTLVEPMDYCDTVACQKIARKHVMTVDAVILCAGVSQRAKATDTHLHTLEQLMRVNAITPMAIAQILFAKWVQRSYGQLVVVSSIASHAPIPLRSSYCAAKAALELHGQAMYNEIAAKKYDIEFVRVIPGFIKTNISRKALTGTSHTWDKDDFQQQNAISCEKAATCIIRLLRKRRTPTNIYIGMTAKLRVLACISKYFPRIANFILARSKTT